MKRVVIESPFKGLDAEERGRNQDYARAALLDCLEREEAPFASHLLYPLVLDDDVPEQRALGIKGQVAWIEACDLVVVYCDLGVSGGMKEGIKAAKELQKPIEYRSLQSEAELRVEAIQKAFEAMGAPGIPKAIVT